MELKQYQAELLLAAEYRKKLKPITRELDALLNALKSPAIDAVLLARIAVARTQLDCLAHAVLRSAQSEQAGRLSAVAHDIAVYLAKADVALIGPPGGTAG